MTGYKDHNYPAFHKYAKLLRDLGYTVFSPAECDDVSNSFESCMTKDLDMVINKCRAIAILPGSGWRKSVGANAEVNTAHVCGKPVYHIVNTRGDYSIRLDRFKTKDKTPYNKTNITRASLLKNFENPK